MRAPELLEGGLLERFGRGVDAPLPESEFNRLALEVFEYQFERNAPYRHFCRVRGMTPEAAGDWRDVPALHTSAFKEIDLATVPPEEVRVEYRTSGTSRGKQKPGRHLLPDAELYDASLRPNFKAHVLADAAAMRILVFGPTARYFPHSSLGHMHSAVMEEFGASGSGVFWDDGGPRITGLAAALRKAEEEGVPVCLLGTVLGFLQLLDWLREEGRRFRLPPGSRIMDTGGYKGLRREIPRAELYARYEEALGLPESHVVNEYGMTELASQFYDQVLRIPGVRAKRPPPWARVLVVDPESLAPLPRGKVGLLRFFDLANLHTVAAIQSDDLGVWEDDGFEILGRASGAEPRGCSLAAEEPAS